MIFCTRDSYWIPDVYTQKTEYEDIPAGIGIASGIWLAALAAYIAKQTFNFGKNHQRHISDILYFIDVFITLSIDGSHLE